MKIYYFKIIIRLMFNVYLFTVKIKMLFYFINRDPIIEFIQF